MRKDGGMNPYDNLPASPTIYKGVQLRSQLEARWAAMFDLIGWQWWYEPVSFADWMPDFKVAFPCPHSECPALHELLAEVKPYESIEEFAGHPVMRNAYGRVYGLDGAVALGIDPGVAFTEFAHGSGGGVVEGRELLSWTDPNLSIDELWARAEDVVIRLPKAL